MSSDLAAGVTSAIYAAEFEFWSLSPVATQTVWRDGLIEAVAHAVVILTGSVEGFRRLRKDSDQIRYALRSILDRATEIDGFVGRALTPL